MTAKTKQRSLHMDDEVFALLTDAADAQHTTRSNIVRALILEHLRGSAPSAQERQQPASLFATDPLRSGSATRKGAAKPAAGTIALPDPAVGSFDVKGGTVHGRRLKEDNMTSGPPPARGGFSLE